MPGRSVQKRARWGTGALFVLATALALSLTAPAAAVGTLDQSQESSSSTILAGGSKWIGQTFTAGISGNLDQVDVQLFKYNAPGDLNVSIYAVDGSGLPTGAPLTTEIVAAASVPTSLEWLSVPLDPPVAVSSGTKYAIVLSASGDGSNAYSWSLSLANPYTEGDSVASDDGGSNWYSSSPLDQTFRTYVTATTGTLEVKKFLVPTSDSGRFNLWIDGTIEKSNAKHGSTTGERTVSAGAHTVKETAYTSATSLSKYISKIECKDNNGTGAVVASKLGAGPLTVNVTAGSDIVCLVLNVRKPGT